jgi:hypothetical protein
MSSVSDFPNAYELVQPIGGVKPWPLFQQETEPKKRIPIVPASLREVIIDSEDLIL